MNCTPVYTTVHLDQSELSIPTTCLKQGLICDSLSITPPYWPITAQIFSCPLELDLELELNRSMLTMFFPRERDVVKTQGNILIISNDKSLTQPSKLIKRNKLNQKSKASRSCFIYWQEFCQQKVLFVFKFLFSIFHLSFLKFLILRFPVLLASKLPG